jgi:DNA-binding NarL/FixJ family response regulator
MRALVKHDAAERERARLTRDLYHTVAQAVPAINEIAKELREHLAPSDERAAAQVERIIELADLELADVRRATVGMSPRALQSHCLSEVVESSLVRFGETAGIKTSWTLEGDTGALPGAVQRCAYMTLQEALTNVRLHSGAGSVRVQLEVGEGLRLAVSDDGRGFDREVAGGSEGLGLEGMAERARALGGSVTVESEPGAGTRVCLELPTVSDADGSLETVREELEPAANGGSTGTLRVFVADSHNLVRAGMTSVLERAGGIRVIGEARSSEEIRGQIARLRPDVILLDDQLEAEPSPALIKELRSSSPNSAVLITVRHAVSGGAELLEAGGSGSIHKGVEPDELVDAVRAVANGAKLIAGPYESANGGENGGTSLSSRERGILALVAAGQTNAEIAESLFFATKTVERHVATIVGKLGARNRAHAAAIAVSRQMIDVDDR